MSHKERYTPEYPSDATPEFLWRELNRISDELNFIRDGHYDLSSVEPSKPRQGDIRYADGTNWNPGNGEGIYLYDGSKWVPIVADNPLTAFGELLVAEPTPIIQLQFPYAVNPRLITSTSQGSGASSVTNSLLTVSTGTTTDSDVHLSSVREAKYHPGQGIVARFTGIFQATGVAGTKAVIGIGTTGDGYFVGYNGTSFGVLRRNGGKPEYRTLTITTGASSGTGNITITLDGTATVVAVTSGDSIQEVVRKIDATTFAGWETEAVGTDVIFISHHASVRSGAFTLVDTGVTGVAATSGLVQTIVGTAATNNWVAQADWNADVMDGTGSSGMTLDISMGNVYEIQFQYLGFGAIKFFVESPATGKFVLVHEIKYANTATTTSVQNPTLPLHIGVVNGTTTSDIVLKTASMAVFTQGEIIRSSGLNNSAIGSRGAYDFTTQTSVLAVKSKSVFQGTVNRTELAPLLLSFSGRGAGACKFHTLKITINPVLGGAPAFTDVSTATSIAAYDTAGTTVTGGNVAATFEFGKTIENFVLNISDIAVFQPPGTLIVFSITIDGGTSDADIGFIWREDF